MLHFSKRLFLDYTSTANLKTISKSEIEYSLIKITDQLITELKVHHPVSGYCEINSTTNIHAKPAFIVAVVIAIYMDMISMYVHIPVIILVKHPIGKCQTKQWIKPYFTCHRKQIVEIQVYV